MKFALAICLTLATCVAWAGQSPAPAAATVIKGAVLEVKEVESYTYLRLKTRDGETWAAVSKAPVAKGSEVTIVNAMTMRNFESKALRQTFPSIVFGTLAGAPGSVPVAAPAVAAAHAGIGAKQDGADVKVPKASGANARTVAEVNAKGTALKDKPVMVRGKVVKFNGGIMGRNWIHLRDGTGSAADNSNDLLVTTTQKASAGDVVTVQGVVRTDRDFGSGYTYKVLIEEATLQQ